MNLSHTFLGEIFVIFHRKYLPFFRYLQKNLVKKICLERKAQNGIFTLSPSNKKSFVVMPDSLNKESRAFFIIAERKQS